MYWTRDLLQHLALGWLVGVSLVGCINSIPVAEDKTLRAAAQQPVPLSQAPTRQVGLQYTLVIVPWKTTWLQDWSELNGHDALRTALANTVFVPVMSAYDVPGRELTRFPQTERALRKSLWRHQPPGQGPSLEAVWYLGEQLGVDAILAYGMQPEIGTDTVWVHLYDILYKRHYELEGECYYFETESAGVLAGLTQTLFGTFRDYRAQRHTQ